MDCQQGRGERRVVDVLLRLCGDGEEGSKGVRSIKPLEYGENAA